MVTKDYDPAASIVGVEVLTYFFLRSTTEQVTQHRMAKDGQ
jgi:hypothetical protein